MPGEFIFKPRGMYSPNIFLSFGAGGFLPDESLLGWQKISVDILINRTRNRDAFFILNLIVYFEEMLEGFVL